MSKEEMTDFNSLSEREKSRIMKMARNRGDVTTRVVQGSSLQGEELEQMSAIIRKSAKFFHSSFKELMERVKGKDSFLTIAEHDGKIIGFAWSTKGRARNLNLVYVKKEYRRKGIASKISLKEMYDSRARAQRITSGVPASASGEGFMARREIQEKRVKKIPKGVFIRPKRGRSRSS
jgi:GNAT superfamily N-acetyltransferase